MMFVIKNSHQKYNNQLISSLTAVNQNLFIENAKYVDKTKTYSNKKLHKLSELNKCLDYTNTLNKDLFLNAKVYLLNIHDKIIKNEFDDAIEVKLQTNDEKKMKIFEFNNIYVEVNNVANKIASIIDSGVDINDIAVVGQTSEYEKLIQTIFPLYNISVNLDGTKSLYATDIAKTFINNIHLDLEEVFNIIEDKYSSKSSYKPIMEALIKVVNKYCDYHDNMTLIVDYIVEDFKNMRLKKIKYKDAINIINIDSSDEYNNVYVLGFNNGIIYNIKKDNDFFSDYEKTLLNILSSNDLNKINKNNCYNILLQNNIKNISYPLISSLGEMNISNISKMFKNASIIRVEENINNILYSKDASQIEYEILLNKFKNFSEISNALLIYDNNLVRSVKYSSEVKCIKKINDFDRIRLSASTLESFYSCHYRFYLEKILKLYKKNLYDGHLILGNYIHDVLEHVIGKDITSDIIEQECNNFIKNYERKFSIEEMFYLNNLKKEIFKIAVIINDQFKDCTILGLEKSFDFNINDKYMFSGKIDKVIKGENDNLFIIDYKSGNSNLSFDYINQGFDMQNIIYLYLMHKENREYKLGGTYRQNIKPKILNDTGEYIKLFSVNGFSANEAYSFTKTNHETLGLRLKKDGDFYKSKKMVEQSWFAELEQVVINNIDNAIDIMNKKDFVINPKKNDDKDSCKYCNFKEICLKSERDYTNLRKDVNDET
ncbi:MAG: PD-(D/E)XK nuclease family protein [Mycoplasmatales bacterium]